MKARVPEVLYVLFGFNFDKSDSVSFFDFFLNMGKFIEHDFLFVLEPILFRLFKKFVPGHDKVIMLFPDVHASTFPFGLEDSTVRVGSFEFSVDPVIDLNKNKELRQI